MELHAALNTIATEKLARIKLAFYQAQSGLLALAEHTRGTELPGDLLEQIRKMDAVFETEAFEDFQDALDPVPSVEEADAAARARQYVGGWDPRETTVDPDYTEEDAAEDRRILEDDRMQDEAKHAARVRLAVFTAAKYTGRPGSGTDRYAGSPGDGRQYGIRTNVTGRSYTARRNKDD